MKLAGYISTVISRETRGHFELSEAAFINEKGINRLATGPAYAEKIYVSRSLNRVARSRYRLLVNEIDEIEPEVASHGFSIFYLETLSWQEQVRLFSNAKYLIGPSGSGMLNAVFAGQGTRLVDLEGFHVTILQHTKIYSSTKKTYSFASGRLIHPTTIRRKRIGNGEYQVIY